MEPPRQTPAGDAAAVTAGSGVTVTVTVAVAVQPFAVPVMVYGVVAAGLAIGLLQVVQERPVAGDQLYVVPGPLVTLSTVELPAQIVGDEPTVSTGAGVTVTVTVFVPTQPAASVPVTVYVVVADEDALVLAQPVQLRPVAGLHT